MEEYSHSMRRPGIEPESTAWKAAMLTTIPPTLTPQNCMKLICGSLYEPTEFTKTCLAD